MAVCVCSLVIGAVAGRTTATGAEAAVGRTTPVDRDATTFSVGAFDGASMEGAPVAAGAT